MIVFNLICNTCDFEFEAWFSNSREFTNQKKNKLIACPSCESTKINKGVMAPNLNRKTSSKKNLIKKSFASNISKFKKYIEKNYDYVGDKFTDEAKKIKYGESKKRSIYGEASLEQTKELLNEEIDVVPLPFSSKKTN